LESGIGSSVAILFIKRIFALALKEKRKEDGNKPQKRAGGNMSYREASHEEIRADLAAVKTIALVGASANPERPSYDVMRFLQAKGYRVIPVNPGLAGSELLGETVVARLADIAMPVDMVDIFRASDAAGEIADQAIAIGAKMVWMQLGVINPAAAERTLAAGLKVVMNNCPKIVLSGP
jgi:predicted CoA-binding protein